MTSIGWGTCFRTGRGKSRLLPSPLSFASRRRLRWTTVVPTRSREILRSAHRQGGGWPTFYQSQECEELVGRGAGGDETSDPRVFPGAPEIPGLHPPGFPSRASCSSELQIHADRLNSSHALMLQHKTRAPKASMGRTRELRHQHPSRPQV